jgi:ribose-phosphate pyrophosphokinase
MISTGGTILEAVEALLAAGARPDIVVAATHGLLLKGASQNLSHSAIREVLVTDTVHIPHAQLHRVQVVSVAPLLASAIRSLIETG